MDSSLFNLRWKHIRRLFRPWKAYIPEVNFITLHYLYFIGTSLLGSVILYGSARPIGSLPYIDAVFLAVSAMTEAGLNTVNLSTLNTFQQLVLFLLIFIGSAIFVSAFVVFVRRKAFDQRFKQLAWKGRWQRREDLKSPAGRPDQPQSPPSSGLDRSMSNKSESANTPKARHEPSKEAEKTNGTSEAPAILLHHADSDQNLVSDADPTKADTLAQSTSNDIARQVSDRSSPSREREHISFAAVPRARNMSTRNTNALGRALSLSGVGAMPLSRTNTFLTSPSTRRFNTESGVRLDRDRYISGAPSLSRNSAFYNLTEDDREYLGGNEYRAVKVLSYLVPLYLVLWQGLGALGIAAYTSTYYTSTTQTNGLNPWWVGAFNAVSAFNNSGMSLLDANMTVFNRAIYMLITMSLLILAGNTCYPVFLRLIVWVLHKILPDNNRWGASRGTLKFLLDHPRRCYTNLFPSKETWWLLLSVVLLNGFDCAMYGILNIGNTKITTNTPAGIEFIDGLFQAFAVRSGGFYVVAISSVRISLQVLYVIMMYISAFPVAITIRNSNVYEERSLGIYSDDPGYDYLEKELERGVGWFKKRFRKTSGPRQGGYFVSQQLRAQLAHDMWWVVLAVFLIMIVESSQFDQDPVVFSVFNVIFEVVSAYGCVGISVGLPTEAYSFCGAWHKLSKLILCAVMLRGRHRGLPVAIDKALMLPRDSLHDMEDEDAAIRRGSQAVLERSRSRANSMQRQTQVV